MFFDTAELLQKYGHQIAYFAMASPNNIPSPDADYFVPYVDLNQTRGLVNQLKLAGQIIYSLEAKRKITELLEHKKPNLAHLHNIYHQLSPSILGAIKRKKIPIVMTLHDYKLTCPVYTLMRDGKICEECKGGKYYKVVQNHCTKGSRAKSVVNMIEMYLHHTVFRVYNQVDVFISPSRFLKHQIEAMGFPGNIVHLPNFINAAGYEPQYEPQENSLVYFGRLSEEKGVATLVEAVKGLNIPLKIIGDGPQKELLVAKCAQEKIDNVKFLGYKTGKELLEEIRRSAVVVIPSEWYENYPRSVIESFALGKPVIGANIGGIPELVNDGETGYLFEPGNSQALREKIQLVIENRQFISAMGRNARRFAETELNPEQHYQQLMEVYQGAIQKQNK